MVNERARQLRNSATVAERALWYRLRQLKAAGSKFRRQVPIDHFIVDFACLRRRVIVEVDGGTHGVDSEIAYDRGRQRYLEAQGFVVVRVSNDDVASNIDGVMDTIVSVLAERDTPTPNPSPQGGGE